MHKRCICLTFAVEVGIANGLGVAPWPNILYIDVKRYFDAYFEIMFLCNYFACTFCLYYFLRLFQLLGNNKGDHIDPDNTRLTGNHGRTSRLEDERGSMPQVTSMA